MIRALPSAVSARIVRSGSIALTCRSAARCSSRSGEISPATIAKCVSAVVARKPSRDAESAKSCSTVAMRASRRGLVARLDRPRGRERLVQSDDDARARRVFERAQRERHGGHDLLGGPPSVERQDQRLVEPRPRHGERVGRRGLDGGGPSVGAADGERENQSESEASCAACVRDGSMRFQCESPARRVDAASSCAITW